MAKIVDPDQVSLTTEMLIDTAARTIQLVVGGSIEEADPGASNGVTMQALYSALKDEWLVSATLNKFKFPMKSFTKNEFQFINEWAPKDGLASGASTATTRQLLRDGGWEERKTGATQGDKYAGAISLGTFDAVTDQGYYSNVAGTDATSTPFVFAGNINEPVLIDDADGTDFTAYFKAFLREQGKLYSSYNLLTEQGITAMEPTLYRFPLDNATDLNISATDALIDANATITTTFASNLINFNSHPFLAGDTVRFTTSAADLPDPLAIDTTYFVINPNANDFQVSATLGGPAINLTDNGTGTHTVLAWPYAGMSVRYYGGTGFTTAALIDSPYSVGDVVQDGVGRWAYCTGAGTITTPGGAYGSFGGTSTWAAFEGEREIGTGNFYAFDTVIEGSQGLRGQIYEWSQRQLRKTTDINDPDGFIVAQFLTQPIVKGNLADDLAAFRGDSLIMEQGVFVDNYGATEVNDIIYVPIPVDSGTPTEVFFPFTSVIQLNLPSNVVNEVAANVRGKVYFTTSISPALYDFDTVNAIVVKDATTPTPLDVDFDGTDIGLDVSNAIVFDYAYDTNVQRGNSAGGPDAPVTLQLVGLAAFEIGTTEFTITRTANITVNVVATDERNYLEGSVP